MALGLEVIMRHRTQTVNQRRGLAPVCFGKGRAAGALSLECLGRRARWTRD